MKKLFLLLMVVAVVLVGAQAFASPPIAPPVEGFVITSSTTIVADGTVTENERYNWTYFEGWGQGPFFPAGYIPRGCGTGAGCVGVYSELGFTEGAEIAYQQSYVGVKGHTEFVKTFAAYSNPDPAQLQNNLKVHKEIDYLAADLAVGRATHSEKVGLSVVSMGATSSSGSNPAQGLLSLCPWSASTPGVDGGAYPPTNEGIAAGSSFKVSRIQGFVSDSEVNSVALPMLKYDIVTESGAGFIDAGFVVELFEGPKGTTWAPQVASVTCHTCDPTPCDPRGGTICYENQVAPPLASRTSYKEYASADGTWVFQKHVKYESKMPAGASSSTFPINTVLVH